MRAPISAEVMRGSRSTQAIAICASDLAAALRDLVERAHAVEVLLGEEALVQEGALGRARLLGDAVEVLRGQHALAERREDDAADALLPQHVEQVLLDPAVEEASSDGWWMSSGVPSSSKIRTASAVRGPE